MTLTFAKASAVELAAAEALYATCGYRRGIAAEDQVFIAKVGDTLCGVLRFASESGLNVLRGVQILPRFQRQGIGTQFLRAALALQQAAECYCIPRRHLEGFYSELGFKVVDKALAPIFLQQRLDGYRAEGLDAILMLRVGD